MNLPPHAGGLEPPTAVIDFDGTLSESYWPLNTPGPAIQSGVDAILHYRRLGLEIVIHTARPESHAPLIWQWLRDHGLDRDVHDVICGKPRGFVYIDDRAFNPTDRWEEEPLAPPPATYMEAETPDLPDEDVEVIG